MTHYWGIDEPLREEDLKVVHNILYPVKIKWREIGLQLKLQPAELQAILRDPNFPDEGLRLMHVLTLWLQNADPLPTWPVIIEALRSQSVNSTRIAEDVRARYCPTYPVELFLPPNPVPPVVISESEFAALTIMKYLVHVNQSNCKVYWYCWCWHNF